MTPVATDLFESTPNGLRLVAGRGSDGKIVFPLQAGADGVMQERITLPGTGHLWSWTIQRFRPKTPPYIGPSEGEFQPFAVGYVEIDGAVIIESRLLGDFARFRLGMAMTAVTLPVWQDEDGTPVVTFAFAPAEPAAAPS